MEIDKDKLCEFLLALFDDTERVEKELLAHRAFFTMMQASQTFSDLDRVLDLARERSAHVLDKKYADQKVGSSNLSGRTTLGQQICGSGDGRGRKCFWVKLGLLPLCYPL